VEGRPRQDFVSSAVSSSSDPSLLAAKLGIEARAGTPQAFGAAMADDMAKYDEIVRLTRIKVD
jgi:hypothetical protein